MPSRERDSPPLAGIGLFVLAVLLLSVMDVLIKLASANFPTGQVMFFRGLFAFIPLAIVVWWSGGLTALVTQHPYKHLGRGIAAITAATGIFVALRELPLVDVYAIAFSAPLFMTLLSIPLLGERVGPHRWAAVFVGFAGVLVALRPGEGGVAGYLSLGAAAALVGAFAYAFVAVYTRRISDTESTASIVVYSTGAVTVAAACTLPFDAVMPTPSELALLAGTGILGGMGTVTMATALRRCSAAILAPFEYTAIVWGVAFGWWIWADIPDAGVLVGSTIVITSGLYILHRERTRRHMAAFEPADRSL